MQRGGPVIFGYRPDPEDERDFVLAKLDRLELAPPRAASVHHPDLLIRDQGATGSCVGQAISNAVRLGYLVGNGDENCPDLSALFAYHEARILDGGPMDDVGATIRSGVKGVQKSGVAPASTWPFDEGQVNEMPSWRAYRSAHDRRGLRGYYRIPGGDVEGVRKAIAARCPVVGGWMIDREFMHHQGGSVLGVPREPFLGGHAILIESYDGDTFTIVNSWGVGWGDGGRARVSAAFVAAGRDLWAIDV